MGSIRVLSKNRRQRKKTITLGPTLKTGTGHAGGICIGIHSVRRCESSYAETLSPNEMSTMLFRAKRAFLFVMMS
jgi:hypothetical protein